MRVLAVVDHSSYKRLGVSLGCPRLDVDVEGDLPTSQTVRPFLGPDIE